MSCAAVNACPRLLACEGGAAIAIALKVSSRVCVMGHRSVVFEGTLQQVAGDEKLLSEWLAV